MTDIVERLCWCPEYGGWSDAVVLMPEAANEIKRLRAFEWAWWQLSLELRKDMANDCPSEFTMALRRALEDKP